MPKPKSVREPIQVYLDAHDRSMLDAMAKRSAVPRSEVLRLALRRLSEEMLSEDRPGASLSALLGVLDGSPDVPADLSARHDAYLYSDAPQSGHRADR